MFLFLFILFFNYRLIKLFFSRFLSLIKYNYRSKPPFSFGLENEILGVSLDAVS